VFVGRSGLGRGSATDGRPRSLYVPVGVAGVWGCVELSQLLSGAREIETREHGCAGGDRMYAVDVVQQVAMYNGQWRRRRRQAWEWDEHIIDKNVRV